MQFDNSPFAVAHNIKDVIRSLEEVDENLITWLNSDKCHLFLNTNETINPLSANPTKWSNTLNCLSVFDHFVRLTLKELKLGKEKP